MTDFCRPVVDTVNEKWFPVWVWIFLRPLPFIRDVNSGPPLLMVTKFSPTLPLHVMWIRDPTLLMVTKFSQTPTFIRDVTFGPPSIIDVTFFSDPILNQKEGTGKHNTHTDTGYIYILLYHFFLYKVWKFSLNEPGIGCTIRKCGLKRILPKVLSTGRGTPFMIQNAEFTKLWTKQL